MNKRLDRIVTTYVAIGVSLIALTPVAFLISATVVDSVSVGQNLYQNAPLLLGGSGVAFLWAAVRVGETQQLALTAEDLADE